jgi:hypothetical protein
MTARQAGRQHSGRGSSVAGSAAAGSTVAGGQRGQHGGRSMVAGRAVAAAGSSGTMVALERWKLKWCSLAARLNRFIFDGCNKGRRR